MQLTSEVRQYFRRIGTFSRNAKLYLVSTTLLGLSFGIWSVIFNLYLNLDEIGFQADFISNMFSVSAAATGLVALPAGLLCERIGPKKALLVSLTSNLISFIQIFALKPSILLLASLTGGLIGTVGWVASVPFMTENSLREERTYLFSVDWSAMTIMGVVGSYTGGFMPDMLNAALWLPTGVKTGSPIGYRIALAISIAFALASAIPILLVKEDNRVQRQKSVALLSLKNIQSPRTIVKFMIPTAIIGLGAGFIIPLFNLFFKLRFAATAEQVGVIFALGNVTLGIGTLIAPMLSKRMGKVKTVVASQYLSIPFIMLMTLAPNLTLSTTAYLARETLMNMAGPVSTALMMEMVTETERATTSGFMVMADNIPRAVTASISGKMMTGNDFFTPFIFTTIMYFVASSLYFIFFRKAESEEHGSAHASETIKSKV